jgi:hypothetical protein
VGLESDFQRAALRAKVKAALRAELTKLDSADDRRAVLFDLATEADGVEQAPTLNGHSHEASDEQPAGPTAITMSMLSADNGVTTEAVAEKVYPDMDKDERRRKATYVLHWLKRTKRAVKKRGKWFLGPGGLSAGKRKPSPDSVGAIIVRALGGHQSGLTSAKIITEVNKTKSAHKTVVYNELQRLKSKGMIEKRPSADGLSTYVLVPSQPRRGA